MPKAVLTWTPSPTLKASATISPTSIPSATSTTTPDPSATPTPTSSPTLTPTMSALGMFTTRLREGVQPMTYLDDQCSYIKARWSPNGSAPGTVVVPIMFHTIAKDGTELAYPTRDITVSQFMDFVSYANELGFATITSQQLLDFLTNNSPIPTRSMMLILDDRRPGTIRDQFMPVLDEYNWTVTAAYIADPTDMEYAWNQMEELNATGKVDVQSHGYTGRIYIYPYTPLDQIQSEIWDSTPVLQEHFGTKPIAFIWPGGDFTPVSVQIAREGGYQLGFTAYSRGPIMFNWVPLGEPEREVNDPLMVLPRAWSSAANANLNEAVTISEQAAAYAEQNYPIEAAWYRIYCGGELDSR